MSALLIAIWRYRGQNAERDHPYPVDVPLVPQKLDQAKRQQPAVHLDQHLVDVREAEQEARHLAVHFGDQAHLGIEHELEILREVSELAVRHRDRVPVVLPRLVVDPLDEIHFAREALHVHAADGERVALAQGGHAALQALRRRAAVVLTVVREEVHRLAEAVALDQPLIVGRVVRHHDEGRAIEAADQQPDVVVDRQVLGPANQLHPFRAEERRRRVEERSRHLLAVDRLEQPEEAGLLAVARHVRVVHDRRDAPGDVAARVAREEQLHVGVLEERVLRRIQEILPLHEQRRHPVRVSAIDGPGEADEMLLLTGGRYRLDHHGHGMRVLLKGERKA